ncbi:LLM class flavin-dependent oxidoreductase (plasmid) [Aliirhizobium terrae]|uniref:LLM class flavin-dependent oxidoreductase n=1 Tax=Terrirhizobium terrae TaxID=2926709 RepID=UPI0025787603|nr:LLM class flavin-dependent oxidoreductase [Rhizobium sp. CC-CFT758]WJH38744.1 LLM class flavin-dependent oxidoreductase [Rhizobium sp. CC-CFT758]
MLGQVAAAEAAGFDFVLLSDRLGLRPVNDLSSVAVPFEPTLSASALATRAGRIGIIAAASTVQHEPYNLARRFASLDLISKGRAGWLVVTDDSDAGRESEYVDVVTALWDSFEDDAFLYDKRAGRFFDPSKMHVAYHKGPHFSVRGPLNVNRSPQGRPLVAHLLADSNKALAARTGDLLLLQAETADGLVTAAAHAVKAVEAAGRSRRGIRLLASIVPIIVSGSQGTDDASGFPGYDQAVRIAGTTGEITDQLLELAAAAGLDGFTIFPPTLKISQRFISEIAPELRQRGMTGPNAGTTLRDRLGLAQSVHPSALGEEISR